MSFSHGFEIYPHLDPSVQVYTCELYDRMAWVFSEFRCMGLGVSVVLMSRVLHDEWRCFVRGFPGRMFEIDWLIGDRGVLVFGYPVVVCDDVFDAARACISMCVYDFICFD
jgi:hypothetical protein